jgi:hypothetical protein
MPPDRIPVEIDVKGKCYPAGLEKSRLAPVAGWRDKTVCVADRPYDFGFTFIFVAKKGREITAAAANTL